MRKFRRIQIFTDRFPWLGPLVYILSVEFFVVQLVAASAWKLPYSWRLNTISDLGRAACGLQDGYYICSPLHAWMNLSLIIIGAIMAGGSLLIYQEFRESRATFIGFTLMAIAGFGTVIAGVFTEDINPQLHVIGASMPFVLGNASLLVLGIALRKAPRLLRIYTFLSGLIALAALLLFVLNQYGGLGKGGLERVVAYPQIIWLITFGFYMSENHTAYIRRVRKAIKHRLTDLRQQLAR